MTGIADLIPPDDLAALERALVAARSLVEGPSTGQHRSPNKGASIEFRQHRPYVTGDDLRRLDWKAYARLDRFFIREHEDETSLRATIVLDASGSMGYGGADGRSKLAHAKRLAAGLAYLLIGQGDSVGLAVTDRTVRDLVPPRSGPGHLRHLAAAIAKAEPGGETALSDVIDLVEARLQRRGLVVLISDLMDEATPLVRALARLRYGRHDVAVLHVLHRDELEFPFAGWTRFEGMERTEEAIADPAHLRAAYLQALQAWRADLADGCRRQRIDLALTRCDEPCGRQLATWLGTRAAA